MPELTKLYGRYKDHGLVLMAVHTDPDLKKRDDFVKELKLPFPVAQDDRNVTQKAYKIIYIPTTFVIDRKGKIVAAEPQDLEKAIKAALAKK